MYVIIWKGDMGMKGKIALATLAMIPMTANNAYASNIGTVTASSLNVRSGPSTNYTVVTTVKKNDKVTRIYYDHKPGNILFINVRTKYRYLGIHKTYDSCCFGYSIYWSWNHTYD